MIIIITLLFLSMFVYVNTLYYRIVLLAIVLTSLYILVSNLMLNTLTIIILAIVYVGAMMILIGYICAVCPNMILNPSIRRTALFTLIPLCVFLFFPISASPAFRVNLIPLVSYFYSYSGFVVFMVLVLMLFITLLMVTSQYMTPKGPFRALSV